MASPSPVQQGSPTPGDKTELIVAEPVVPFSTRCLKTLGSPAVWRGLLLGQVISFLLSFSGICSEYLTENNVRGLLVHACATRVTRAGLLFTGEYADDAVVHQLRLPVPVSSRKVAS